MKKIPLSRGVHLLPSLCTTVGMFGAFFSIIRSINGDHHTAAWAIFFASFFDMIDGRIARMMGTQSDFGREYDSLVDLASFGLAPSILIYTYSLAQFRPIGWFFAFLFFACAALRLARFNVQIDSIEKKRFQGLPSPPAACLVASLVLFYQNLYGRIPIHSYAALILVPFLALLMVSRIPYRSFKEYELKKGNSFYILTMAVVLIGLVALNPDVILFALLLTYAVSGPVMEAVSLRKTIKSVKKPVRMRTKPRRFVLIGNRENDREVKKLHE